MEHYLTHIKIKKLRHLSDLVINLSNDERKHLLLTGKNGSGKTTVLLAVRQYLKAINEGNFNKLKSEYNRLLDDAKRKLDNAKTDVERHEKQKKVDLWENAIARYNAGLELEFSKYEDLDTAYRNGDYIIAYFAADRKTRIIRAHGVEDVKLNDFYGLDTDPGSILLKYMVHLKTQQSYARNEGDIVNALRIQKWFDRFESALKNLFDDDSIKLVYEYKAYDFKIVQNGKEPFGFDQLSDGYSSVIHIVSDLILRMDKNWILKDKLSSYDIEGIVMIDELETHLHIELQKKILPFLTEFFPRLQFIVTTHSPYILNSVANAKAYDLEKQMELDNLSIYSSEDLAEAYFDADEYSENLKKKIEKYEELIKKENLTDDDRALRAELRYELGGLSGEMSNEIKTIFNDIESKRKTDG